MNYIRVDEKNVSQEHICCAFSDKKCSKGYEMKKQWLSEQSKKGFKFIRLDERTKVFIEYGPAEEAWQPVVADNYFVIGCMWVSGKYKKCGHGKQLLKIAIDDAKKQGKDGIVVVVGKKKMHFLTDGKWFKKQGFVVCDEVGPFQLLEMKISKLNTNTNPRFNESVRLVADIRKDGVVVYYSNRCPFTEYHVNESLIQTLEKRNIPLEVVKIDNKQQAQTAPTPATIFSLYLNGEFVTTDVSMCMDSRFDKLLKK